MTRLKLLAVEAELVKLRLCFRARTGKMLIRYDEGEKCKVIPRFFLAQAVGKDELGIQGSDLNV